MPQNYSNCFPNGTPPTTYTGNGTETTYNIGFPYQYPTDVLVFVDNALQVNGTDYTMITNNTQILFTTAPSGAIYITRQTTLCGTVEGGDFTAGDALTANKLNAKFNQQLFINQEQQAILQGIMGNDPAGPGFPNILPGERPALGDLEDVNLANPIPNPSLIRWNGTEWVNNDVLESGDAWASNNNTFATTAAGDDRWLNATGGDIIGGPGITTTEDGGTVTVSADLEAAGAGEGGLVFDPDTGNTGEIRVNVSDGLELTANGVAVDLANTSGLEFTGGDLRIDANDGCEIVADGLNAETTAASIVQTGGTDANPAIRIATTLGTTTTNTDLVITGGANTTVTRNSDGELTIASTGGGGGGDISVEDDGTEIVATASTVNFTGAGVTVTDAGGGQANIAIPGAGAGVVSVSPNPPAAATPANEGELWFNEDDGQLFLSFTDATPSSQWIAAAPAAAGGGVPNLQAVTDEGNTTTNEIVVDGVNIGAGPGTGGNNTRVGDGALDSNDTGASNTAVGRNALAANTSAAQNTAIGFNAMQVNTTGTQNVAVGANALANNEIGAGSVAVGRSALFNNTASNNIAIGQNAGNALTNGANNTILGNLTGTAGMANTMLFGAGNNERFRVDGNGVFLYNSNNATNWPANTRFIVQDGSNAGNQGVTVGGTDGTTQLSLCAWGGANNLSFVSRIQNNTDGLSFWTSAEAGNSPADAVPAERMLIDTTGNVEIGGTVQSGGEALNGTEAGVLLRGTSGMIHVTTPASASAIFHGFSAGNSTPTISMFGNGGVEFANSQFTVAANGNVSISRTDDNRFISLNSQGQLTINGAGAGTVFSIQPEGTTTNTLTIDGNGNVRIAGGTGEGNGIDLNAAGILQASRSGPTNRVFEGFNDGVTSSEIFANGNMTIDGTLTENGSDIKFKKELRSVPTSQLEDIKNLQLKEWTWTDDAPSNEEVKARRNRGLIAQEAELIDPKLVYETYRGDEDDENRLSYKAIDHQVLIMKLLGAVQELSAEVQALKEAQ